MTAWDFLKDLHTTCSFQSREKRVGVATNSELKRWIQNKALEINGRKCYSTKRLTSLYSLWYCSQRKESRYFNQWENNQQ